MSQDDRRTIHARPGRSATGDKLPIYPNPDSDVPVRLIESPNPLSPHIARAREATAQAFSGASGYVERGVGRWIGFERTVEREVKSVLPADESLTPGIIYVLISGLSASVLTRTRSLPIRFLAPPLFTLAAMPYFLPRTSHNLRSYFSDVEDDLLPDIAARHDRLTASLSSHWDLARNRMGRMSEEARGLGQKAVEGVERSTGLKVGEAVRSAEREREREREKSSRQEVETIGYVVEQKPVAEIVVPVGPAPPGDVKRMV